MAGWDAIVVILACGLTFAVALATFVLSVTKPTAKPPEPSQSH